MNHVTSPRFGLAMVFGVGFLTLATVDQSRADVEVIVDQAKVIRLPTGVSTVVIGNPMIADISVQRSGIAIVTGKTYGVTNMIIMDGRGTTLSEEQVVVRAPEKSLVTVQRGMDRETLTCSPLCEKTVKVGDAQANFDIITGQSSSRSSLAGGMATSK